MFKAITDKQNSALVSTFACIAKWGQGDPMAGIAPVDATAVYMSSPQGCGER